MRLIDADALMENYGLKDATKYGNKDAEQQEHSYSTLMLYEIADIIEDAPTVEAKPVVHGRWLEFDIDYGCIPTVGYQCSECGQSNGFITDFCPNCGADMRGGKNE